MIGHSLGRMGGLYTKAPHVDVYALEPALLDRRAPSSKKYGICMDEHTLLPVITY